MSFRLTRYVASLWLIPMSIFGVSLCSRPSNAQQTGQGSSAELTFTLAPGMSIEKVADESLVKWPIVADWDSQGRMVVVESAGVAKPIEKHNEQLLHRIVRLVDDNGDGVFDRRILAADKLPFTEGVLCLGNDMLITAPPYIWKLTDADSDGYCESRQVWFDGQTLTGCANDLHGPYLGRDGWIYWCKGAFAKQNHAMINGRTLSDGAAHIHRRRELGSNITADQKNRIEPVMSGGMDNPVEVASLPNGERFFTSTFLVHPGDGKRDGVAHAIYGGAYGKDHAALTGVVRTGPLMPIMTHLGAAAPSGLICLESDQLVKEGRQTLVAALFNLQKVTGLTLQPLGATFQSKSIDLLVGNRVDFHPTDVLEDADGSLLVVDTGGWYDLCCPTSRVDQFTAPGGIYRLKKANQAFETHSSDKTVDWENLKPNQAAELINNNRPWVARMALIKIANSGDWATSELSEIVQSSALPLHQRTNALWALGAAGSERGMQLVAKVIDAREGENAQPQLQQVACHLISLYRYTAAKKLIERLIAHSAKRKDWATARVAIEALGKIGDAESIELLFGCVTEEADRFYDHSLRYALFELENSEATAKFLTHADSMKRKLALTTLDLLQSKEYLTATALTQAANDPMVVDAAAELLVKRPELAREVLESLGKSWKAEFSKNEPPVLFERLASGWRDQPAWQQFIADSIASATGETGWKWKETLLRTRAGTHIPALWFPWVEKALQEDALRTGRLIEGANLATAEQVPLVEFILALVTNESRADVKKQLLVSLPARPACNDPQLVEELMGALAESISKSQSTGSIWKCLKRLKIDRKSAEQVTKLSPKFSPSDLVQALELVASLRDDALDTTMLDQLAQLKAAKAIPTNSLINLYRDRSESVRGKAKSVADGLLQADPQVRQTVKTLLDRLPEGDPIRGLTLYHSSKANCGACHQMGYRGGKIGPELSKIGSSRTRDALLEAILYPSQRIEQGFDTVQVLTLDGRVFNGIVTARNDKEVSIRVSADKIETVAIADIEEQRPSEVSIMPAGMHELLSEQEIADVISLLEAAK